MLSPFLFAVVLDVFTELAIQGVLSELLYTDDLVLMSETFALMQIPGPLHITDAFLHGMSSCGTLSHATPAVSSRM